MTEFNPACIREEDVASFEVSMDYFVSVDELECHEHLQPLSHSTQQPQH